LQPKYCRKVKRELSTFYKEEQTDQERIGNIINESTFVLKASKNVEGWEANSLDARIAFKQEHSRSALTLCSLFSFQNSEILEKFTKYMEQEINCYIVLVATYDYLGTGERWRDSQIDFKPFRIFKGAKKNRYALCE